MLVYLWETFKLGILCSQPALLHDAAPPERWAANYFSLIDIYGVH